MKDPAFNVSNIVSLLCVCVCVCLGLEFIVIYLFVLKPIKNVRCSSSEPSRSSYYLKRIDCVCRTVLDIPRGMELCGRGRLEIVCYLIIFFSFTRDAFKHHNPPLLKLSIFLSFLYPHVQVCPRVVDIVDFSPPPPTSPPIQSSLLPFSLGFVFMIALSTQSPLTRWRFFCVLLLSCGGCGGSLAASTHHTHTHTPSGCV